MFSRLAKYVITQVHARRKEEVMAIGGDGEKRTRTLLDFNFVKKKKFDEEQDENDWGSDRVKLFFVFCTVSLYACGNSGHAKSFVTTLSFSLKSLVILLKWIAFTYFHTIAFSLDLYLAFPFMHTTCTPAVVGGVGIRTLN